MLISPISIASLSRLFILKELKIEPQNSLKMRVYKLVELAPYLCIFFISLLSIVLTLNDSCNLSHAIWIIFLLLFFINYINYINFEIFSLTQIIFTLFLEKNNTSAWFFVIYFPSFSFVFFYSSYFFHILVHFCPIFLNK